MTVLRTALRPKIILKFLLVRVNVCLMSSILTEDYDGVPPKKRVTPRKDKYTKNGNSRRSIDELKTAISNG
jgi:hypothetical protein